MDTVQERLAEYLWKAAGEGKAKDFCSTRAWISEAIGVAKSPSLVGAIALCIEEGIITQEWAYFKGRPVFVYRFTEQAIKIAKANRNAK